MSNARDLALANIAALPLTEAEWARLAVFTELLVPPYLGMLRVMLSALQAPAAPPTAVAAVMSAAMDPNVAEFLHPEAEPDDPKWLDRAIALNSGLLLRAVLQRPAQRATLLQSCRTGRMGSRRKEWLRRSGVLPQFGISV